MLDTRWSLVLAMNSILYLCLSVFTVLMLVGALWWPLACGGSIGHCCGGWVQALIIIMTGAYRYSEDGNLCAQNEAFVTIADKIAGLYLA